MSTIAELRLIFTDRSGDLNMADADIDRYVNAGVELLDMLTQFSHAPAKYYAELAIGSYNHTFGSKNRVVYEVWIIDGAEGRTKLEKINYSDLREQYSDVPNTARDTPLYYAVDINRAFPTTFDETALDVSLRPHIDTVAADYLVKGIMFMPPTEKLYGLEVIGKFHSPVLSDLYTQNWWSVNYPDLTILAAMYQLEGHYRNTAGMQDYMKTMSEVLKGISDDRAEEDAANFSVMRG